VRLPQNRVKEAQGVGSGEGKPENQNASVIFCFGEAIQASGQAARCRGVPLVCGPARPHACCTPHPPPLACTCTPARQDEQHSPHPAGWAALPLTLPAFFRACLARVLCPQAIRMNHGLPWQDNLLTEGYFQTKRCTPTRRRST
jgi:hypothetical protein